jgi:hypothetical protein
VRGDMADTSPGGMADTSPGDTAACLEDTTAATVPSNGGDHADLTSHDGRYVISFVDVVCRQYILVSGRRPRGLPSPT